MQNSALSVNKVDVNSVFADCIFGSRWSMKPAGLCRNLPVGPFITTWFTSSRQIVKKTIYSFFYCIAIDV